MNWTQVPVLVSALIVSSLWIPQPRRAVTHARVDAWKAQADQASANISSSVATAGDVNGDGFGDVIVGAAFYDDGQTD